MLAVSLTQSETGKGEVYIHTSCRYMYVCFYVFNSISYSWRVVGTRYNIFRGSESVGVIIRELRNAIHCANEIEVREYTGSSSCLVYVAFV